MYTESKPAKTESKFKCECGWLPRVIAKAEKEDSILCSCIDCTEERERESHQAESEVKK